MTSSLSGYLAEVQFCNVGRFDGGTPYGITLAVFLSRWKASTRESSFPCSLSILQLLLFRPRHPPLCRNVEYALLKGQTTGTGSLYIYREVTHERSGWGLKLLSHDLHHVIPLSTLSAILLPVRRPWGNSAVICGGGGLCPHNITIITIYIQLYRVISYRINHHHMLPYL